jgi:DNA-directed RNA polymerase specialized sigma24 family protein
MGDWVLDTHGPLANPQPHSLEDEVLDAIDHLPESDKLLVRMRYYEQLTYEQMAVVFGLENPREKRQLMYYRTKRAEGRLKEALLGNRKVVDAYEDRE